MGQRALALVSWLVLLGASSLCEAAELVTIRVPPRSASPLAVRLDYDVSRISVAELAPWVEVEGVTTPFTLHPDGPGGPPVYDAFVDVAGLPYGPHLVRAHWSDLGGTAAIFETSFFHDEPPKISFEGDPLPEVSLWQAAGPFRCSCRDDGPRGCLGLVGHVAGTACVPTTDGVTVDVPVEGSEGHVVTVACEATDEASQIGKGQRQLWVDRRNRLRWEEGPAVVPPIVYEVEAPLDTKVYLRDVTSGRTTLILAIPNDEGSLTFAQPSPAGLWVVVHNGLVSPGSETVYLYAHDELTVVETKGFSFTHGRKHLAWLAGGSSTLVVRDLEAAGAVTHEVTSGDRAALEEHSGGTALSDDGVLAFYASSPSALVSYGPGGRTAFAHDDDPAQAFVFDGDGFVCHHASGRLHRLSATADLVLSPVFASPFSYVPPFRLNNGWLAYGKSTAAGPELWLRAPAGDVGLVPHSLAKADGWLSDLSADGQVLFKGDRTFWYRPGVASVELPSPAAEGAFSADGTALYIPSPSSGGRLVMKWPGAKSDELLPPQLVNRDLRCSAGGGGGAGGALDGGPDAASDGGTDAASEAGTDASASGLDSGATSGPRDVPKPSGGGGCSCATAPAGSPSAAAALALAAVLARSRRPRHKARA